MLDTGPSPAPSSTPDRLSGLLMARQDSPQDRRAARLRAAALVLVAMACLLAVEVNRQTADSAFEAFARTTVDIPVMELLSEPDKYVGERVHLRGAVVEAVMTDTENLLIVTEPGGGRNPKSVPAPTAGGAVPGVLVVTTSDVRADELLDLWGICLGTTLKPGLTHGQAVPVIRAEYVRSTN